MEEQQEVFPRANKEYRKKASLDFQAVRSNIFMRTKPQN